jgi:hypothetical protein
MVMTAVVMRERRGRRGLMRSRHCCLTSPANLPLQHPEAQQVVVVVVAGAAVVAAAAVLCTKTKEVTWPLTEQNHMAGI